ncbi:unnamed protein product [Linum tenue]|uniref:Uncharacterized protein n=1 Tax=Linum tenue TaxID=586396 RepID=A0AAV0NH82_9ROSI|nr:unnamed protein product [Linum tenue]
MKSRYRMKYSGSTTTSTLKDYRWEARVE